MCRLPPADYVNHVYLEGGCNSGPSNNTCDEDVASQHPACPNRRQEQRGTGLLHENAVEQSVNTEGSSSHPLTHAVTLSIACVTLVSSFSAWLVVSCFIGLIFAKHPACCYQERHACVTPGLMSHTCLGLCLLYFRRNTHFLSR